MLSVELLFFFSPNLKCGLPHLLIHHLSMQKKEYCGMPGCAKDKPVYLGMHALFHKYADTYTKNKQGSIKY